MKLDMAAVGGLMQSLQGELQLVSGTIKEKGQQRFQRAILLAAIIVFGAYYLLYGPSQKNLNQIEKQIQMAQLTAQSADGYKQLRDQIREAYALLPRSEDKDKFLTQAVIETLRSEGITSDSIQPPDEIIHGEAAYQTISVSAQVKFAEVVAWIARLEAARPYLKVTGLDIQKSSRLGYCTIKADVATMIPAPGTAP